jgi:sterol desaturase/sphingolipid hydroxylase (fatty acid hydroxylase superfamily)
MSLESWRIYSLLFVIASALLIVFLERKFPYTKSQKFFRDGFVNDFIFYTLLQSYVLGILISFIIESIDNSVQVSRLKILSYWPVWLQFLFFLITHDFYIYWFHRLQHNSKWLWRIHEAHHSNKDVDWLAGSRSHPLEILINQTIEFAPIILLGAHPAIAIIKGSVDAVWGMYIHSNINVKSGWLQFIINGPEMHRWHHSDLVNSAYNKNFSTKLAVWDWLFNTHYFPASKPNKYGLSDLNFPSNYFKQIIFAFRKYDKY